MKGPAIPWVRDHEDGLVRVELWFPAVDRWERCVLMDRSEARRMIARHRVEVVRFRRTQDPVAARGRLVVYLAEIAGSLVVRTHG